MKLSGRCVVEGCDRPRDSRGMCKSHCGRWRRHGDPLAGNRSPIGGNCTIAGCGKPHVARGLCSMHWSRWQRNGDPSIRRPRYATLRGPASSNWLADENVTYHGMHCRLKSEFGSASEYACVDCDRPAAHWSYDNADQDERSCVYRGRVAVFSLNSEHYQPRCARCHKHFDMRARQTRGLTFGSDGRSRPLSASVAVQQPSLAPSPTPEPLEAI